MACASLHVTVCACVCEYSYVWHVIVCARVTVYTCTHVAGCVVCVCECVTVGVLACVVWPLCVPMCVYTCGAGARMPLG